MRLRKFLHCAADGRSVHRFFSPSSPFSSKCRPVPDFSPVPTLRPSPPMLLLFSSLFSPFPHFYSPRALVSFAIAAAKSLPALSFLSFFFGGKKSWNQRADFCLRRRFALLFLARRCRSRDRWTEGVGIFEARYFFHSVLGEGTTFRGWGSSFLVREWPN